MFNKATYNEEWAITKIFTPKIVFTEELLSPKKTSRKLSRFPLVSLVKAPFEPSNLSRRAYPLLNRG